MIPGRAGLAVLTSSRTCRKKPPEPARDGENRRISHLLLTTEALATGTRPLRGAPTPDVVLDALAVGLHGDGRLTALSSLRNRVPDPSGGTPCRTGCGGGQVLPPLTLERARSWKNTLLPPNWLPPKSRWSRPGTGRKTPCNRHAGVFSFSVSPWRGGRRPELDDFEVLNGGALSAHSHGGRRPVSLWRAPALDVQTFAIRPRDWLLAHPMILPTQADWGKGLRQSY